MTSGTYQRAEEAWEALCSAAVQAAFTDIDAGIVRQWREERDPVRREELHYRQRALCEVQAALLARIDAAANLDARMRIDNSPWRQRWEQARQGRSNT